VGGSRLSQKDEIHHPAGSRFLCPMGEKKIRPAGRAQPHIGDSVRADARPHEDGPIHPGKIQLKVVGPRRHGVLCPGRQGGPHGIRDRCVHLVAAAPDAGSDRHPAIPRVRPVGGRHGLDRPSRDAFRRAPPSRVHGRDHAANRVVDQKRQAVGGGDHQGQVGKVRDQPIVFVCLVQEKARESRARHQRFVHPEHPVAVHLPDPDHLREFKVERPEEAAAVLLDRVWIVADAHPKVERGVGGPAHPALPGAERVHDAVRVLEDLGLDDWR